MYLVTKTVSCPGETFSSINDFFTCQTNAGWDRTAFLAQLAVWQGNGKLVYFTTNMIDADTIQNISLWQDEAAYNEYEAFLATEPFATYVTNCINAGMTLDTVETADV